MGRRVVLLSRARSTYEYNLTFVLIPRYPQHRGAPAGRRAFLQRSMLRRLGLTKEPANGTNDGEKDATSVVSRPDPYVETRFLRVVYPGRIAVRSTPAEPAPEDGQV